MLVKSALFFGLFARFKLRARTSLHASLTLANYSEFGLIVAALGVANGWLDARWLIVLATALSLSCAVAVVLNAAADGIHQRYRAVWTHFERSERLPDERSLDIGGASIAILGMGRIGTAAYDHMQRLYGGAVVGVDFDPHRVRHHQSAGRRVLLGDPGDGDFWERVRSTQALDVVMLALPNLAAKLAVLDRISASAFEGRIAAAVRFPDEIDVLREAGCRSCSISRPRPARDSPGTWPRRFLLARTRERMRRAIRADAGHCGLPKPLASLRRAVPLRRDRRRPNPRR